MSKEHRNISMLDDANKRVSEARGALSAMFRTILLKRNIDHYAWGQLMNAYLDDPANGIRNNSRDRSSGRGNLNKELNGAAMTWRVFRKGIDFIRPDIADMTMRLEWPDGETTEVTLRLRENPDRKSTPKGFFDGDREDEEKAAARRKIFTGPAHTPVPNRTLRDIRSVRPHIRRFVQLQPLIGESYSPQAPNYPANVTPAVEFDADNYDFRLARQGMAEDDDIDGWLATTYAEEIVPCETELTLLDQIAIEDAWHRVAD